MMPPSKAWQTTSAADYMGLASLCRMDCSGIVCGEGAFLGWRSAKAPAPTGRSVRQIALNDRRHSDCRPLIAIRTLRGVTPATLVHFPLVQDHVAMDRCRWADYIVDGGNCYRDGTADRRPIARQYRTWNLSSASARAVECDVSRSRRLDGSRRKIG